uniref:Calmodulin binding protein-like N-terminal domain-containing protein n=1 Tax=Aegilops tauschii subsp. strangulata TaxID=200361 RepID=A0A453DTS4_AEGTS
MAAHKRLHDGFEQDPDQPEKKRMERVIREAMVMKQVQSVFLVLEPLLRRVVQEEIQAGLVRSPRYIERSSPETPPAAERPALRLAFLNPPMLPIFTGSKIEDVNGEPLQVILVDADTGSPRGALPQFMRVELVPLFGDFPPDGREEWTAGEFARGVVKERAGKRPLLTGDVGLTMRDGRAVVNDLQFTDNSSWVRCRKFRIGARVVPGSYEGARVAEAMTEAFNVRDHRGERTST